MGSNVQLGVPASGDEPAELLCAAQAAAAAPVDGELVAELVQRERQTQPRLGTRKLHHLLKPELEQAGVRMGRDRMFEELQQTRSVAGADAGALPAHDAVLPQSAGVSESD